jgi:hypothetical protein
LQCDVVAILNARADDVELEVRVRNRCGIGDAAHVVFDDAALTKLTRIIVESRLKGVSPLHVFADAVADITEPWI